MPRDNRLPSYESLLEFQEVYLRAVALAWTNPEFKAILQSNPQLALENYFGYRLPWNIELEVNEANDGQHGWNQATKTWNLPPIGVAFGLPDKPQADEQLVAFAAYNDAGPTYLFTCC